MTETDRKPRSLSDSKDEFKSWLTGTKHLGQRPARDTISRCRRIERELECELHLQLSSVEGYFELMQKIDVYASRFATSDDSAKSIRGALRAAARKFGEFKHPDICYPRWGNEYRHSTRS